MCRILRHRACSAHHVSILSNPVPIPRGQAEIAEEGWGPKLNHPSLGRESGWLHTELTLPLETGSHKGEEASSQAGIFAEGVDGVLAAI